MSRKKTIDHKQGKEYRKDSLEFNRVINLSDAVFAIAMTLLVLTIDIPDVPAEKLGEALLAQAPQFAALILSFSLVAMIWWQHHSHFAMLVKMDSVLIALNMVFLGVVILVPYPTNLLGNDPQAKVALIFFIITFILLNLTFIMIMVRAHYIDAFTEPMTGKNYSWELTGWFIGVFILIIALLVGFWSPLASLIILAVSLLINPILNRPMKISDSH